MVLSAPSGAGKTTLARLVIKRLNQTGQQAGFSVSYTTRAPRPGEVDGRDYHFVSVEQFKAMAEAGQMLEHAEVFGRHYGTGRAATEQAVAAGQIVFLDIDWQGARQLRERWPGTLSSVFILPPSRAALRQRLQGRGQDSAEVIAQRMAQARAEISHFDEFEHLLINDDLEQAEMRLLALCRGHRPADCEPAAHTTLVHSLLREGDALA